MCLYEYSESDAQQKIVEISLLTNIILPKHYNWLSEISGSEEDFELSDIVPDEVEEEPLARVNWPILRDSVRDALSTLTV